MWFGCSDVVAWHLKDLLSEREKKEEEKKRVGYKKETIGIFGGGSTFFLRFGVAVIKTLHAQGSRKHE